MSKISMMAICPKCASFASRRICAYCNSEMIETEITVEQSRRMVQKEKDELIQKYIKTIIKDTYDPEMAKKHDEWWAKIEAERAERFAKPCCPYCKSRFITKVTFFDRLLDTTVWGLASDLIGKTHKCVNCDATW